MFYSLKSVIEINIYKICIQGNWVTIKSQENIVADIKYILTFDKQIRNNHIKFLVSAEVLI